MNKLLLLLTLGICGTLGVVSSKFVLTEISPWMLTIFRYLIGTLAILPLLPKLRKYSWKHIGLLIVICMGIGVNSILYAYGIELTNISVAQVIYLLTPVLVLIGSYIFLEEPIEKQKIIGLIIALLGASIIFILPKIYGGSLAVGSLLGNTYILLAVISYCAYLIFTKKYHFSASELLIGGMIGGLITSIGFGYYKYTPGINPIEHLSTLGIFAILTASLVGTVLFYFLLQKLMKISSPFFVGFTSYVQLIFTIFAGAIFFGDHISLGFIFGSMLTIYGVYYIQQKKK
ncbi:MAG: DMT family transporter [Candidatus Altimarinota bacterium]